MTASDMGKVLSITNIHTSIADFDEDEKVIRSMYTLGGEQDTTFLTEQGALLLIMRSRKPVAKPFQKWVFNVIRTIRKTGKYSLQTEISRITQENDLKSAESEKLFRKYKDAEEERMHKTLVQGFANRKCVYFGKIKTMDDGRILIKIGCTKNIRPRTTGLKQEFKNMAIFRLFECDDQMAFESDLHSKDDIRRYKYREPVNGDKISREVFCMTADQITRAVNIAIRNVGKFRTSNKRGFDELVATSPIVRTLCETVGLQLNENPDQMEIVYSNKRGRCTLTGPKIQAYTEDGSNLVQTYTTLIDAARDLTASNASPDAINKACANKTVKYGYRWAKLQRSSPDNTVQDIGDTVRSNAIRVGIVAAMNADRSEILRVYTSFKACGAEHGFTSPGAIQKRIKRGATVGGHYIVPWGDIRETVQDKWLQNNTLPKLKRNATCKKINRLDPVTSKVLRTYETTQEVTRHFKFGRAALRSAIAGNCVLQAFKWASVDVEVVEQQ